MFGPRCSPLALLVATVVGAISSKAAAATPQLILENDSECAIPAATLREQVERSVAGAPNDQLRFRVRLTSAPEATTAQVQVMNGPETVGIKELRAPTCEELQEAVALVVALALSTTSVESQLTTPSEPTLPSAPPDEPRTFTAVAPGSPTQTIFADPVTDRGPDPVSGSPHNRWGLGLGLGLDQGTDEVPGEMLRATLSRQLPSGSLRASVWYGLATREETIAPGAASKTEAHDFGALTADYCHGLDRAQWLSVCGGLEFAAARVRLRAADGQGASRDVDELSFGAAAGVGALFSYRNDLFQPELNLTAQTPIVRGPYQEPVAFRGTLGVAVPF